MSDVFNKDSLFDEDEIETGSKKNDVSITFDAVLHGDK
jgi:hypothetical protein